MVTISVILPIVIAIFGLVICINLGYMWHNRKKMVAPRIITAADRAKFESKRAESMNKETSLRRQQEDDETKGQRVWFSRWIENGSLRHWVLYTHHTKYELRLPPNTTRLDMLKKTFLSTSNFVCQPAEWDREAELMQMREAYLEREDKPYADGFYICLIGWTNSTPDQVNQAFEEARQESGRYSLFNNCQHFLKRFAVKILDPRWHAADYGWFKDNVDTEYQELLKLPPTQEIVDFQLKMLQQAMMGQAASAQEHARLHHAMHRETQHVVHSMSHHHHHQHQHGHDHGNMLLQNQIMNQQMMMSTPMAAGGGPVGC
jgi:hypothetical protein